MLNQIIKYRDLLFMLIKRDIRIRYKQAAMGVLWAVFMPIIAVSAGVLIKKAMSVVSGTPMDMQGVVSIMVKVLPWTFFVSAIKFSVQSLVGNSSLITKIYFPREVLPVASICACVFDLAIAMAVLTLILAFMKVGVSIHLFWVPLILACLFLFTVGLGLLLSSSNLFYRDVKYVVEVILMFGIFFTPVFYQAHMFGDWKPFLLLNPMGSILESLNFVVVEHRAPELPWMLYAVATSVGIFLLGAKVFDAKEPYFAENI